MMISITKELKVDAASHIAYFYSNPESYLQNVISFASTAAEQGQHVVYIDTDEHYRTLTSHLVSDQIDFLHFVNALDFYDVYGNIDFARVRTNFELAVEPFVDSGQPVRVWAHMDCVDHQEFISKLGRYESACDEIVRDVEVICVCAYNSLSLQGALQLEIMKAHPYVMTDEELVPSNLYQSKVSKPALPSFMVLRELETEMDLYRKKLDFVHVVSHEVRNPLTVIKAYSSILQDDEGDKDRLRRLKAIHDYCTVIDFEISHIIATEEMLIADTMWEKRPIRPRELLEEVLEIMEVRARTQNIQLESRMSISESETVSANSMGFRLMVSNLLSNAIKYSPEASTVLLHCFSDLNNVIIEVHDTGCGIAKSQLERIFKKYERISDQQSGQGIGLYMVQQLVEAFGGSVAVTSEVNEGSCFTVVLPKVR